MGRETELRCDNHSYVLTGGGGQTLFTQGHVGLDFVFPS